MVTTILVGAVAGLNLVSPDKLARLVSCLPSSTLPPTDTQDTVGPDDLVTLFSWLSFSWVNPFINLGNIKELEVEDLPNLSLTMQTAVVFDRFRQIARSSLLWKIILANRLDLFLDFALTLVSVVFNYAGPFFLKKIL